MIYSYESLRKTKIEVERKSKSGRLRPEEAAIGITAAYAIDLIEISRDFDKPRDLSVHTANNMGDCLMRAHLNNMRDGKTFEESRILLAKNVSEL